MATVTITIETDNAAFGDLPGLELGKILEELAHDLAFSPRSLRLADNHRLKDSNGNTVGRVSVTEPPRVYGQGTIEQRKAHAKRYRDRKAGL